MTILDIINSYWKEGVLYLFLGAGLIQISPIKLNPFSWIAKKVGNALNVDVITQLDEQKKAISELEKKLDDHVKENEREKIDECRRRILIFNDKVISEEATVTRERYDSILEDIDMYTEYCRTHPDYPNSKAELSIKSLKEDYLHRYSQEKN